MSHAYKLSALHLEDGESIRKSIKLCADEHAKAHMAVRALSTLWVLRAGLRSGLAARTLPTT